MSPAACRAVHQSSAFFSAHPDCGKMDTRLRGYDVYGIYLI
jgi:hypothetical protein